MPLPVGIKDHCFITHVCVSLCVTPISTRKNAVPTRITLEHDVRGRVGVGPAGVVHPQHGEMFYQ